MVGIVYNPRFLSVFLFSLFLPYIQLSFTIARAFYNLIIEDHLVYTY